MGDPRHLNYLGTVKGAGGPVEVTIGATERASCCPRVRPLALAVDRV